MTTRTTFRIPSSLNDQLLFVSEHIGLAETTIMRTSITDELYSIKGPVPTKLVLNLDQDKVRKTVNLNEFVNGILQHAKRQLACTHASTQKKVGLEFDHAISCRHLPAYKKNGPHRHRSLVGELEHVSLHLLEP